MHSAQFQHPNRKTSERVSQVLPREGLHQRDCHLPYQWTSKLPAPPDATTNTSVVQQVVINIGDNKFGKIFPKSMLTSTTDSRSAENRSAEDDNSDSNDRSNKDKELIFRAIVFD